MNTDLNRAIEEVAALERSRRDARATEHAKQELLGRLAQAIRDHRRWDDDEGTVLAAALLAEGWHPPARRIETAEELEALPAGTIVVETDPDPNAWLRRGLEGDDLTWEEFGSVHYWDSSYIDLPVIVLRTPGGEG